MKICINYLTEVVTLLKEGKLNNLDYIKYPSVSHTSLEKIEYIIKEVGKLINFHGTIAYKGEILGIDDKDFKSKIDIEKTKEVLKLSITKGLSIHVTTKSKSLVIDDSKQDEMYKYIKENIKFLRETFKDLKFLTVENRGGSTFYEYPEFLTKIIEENDCLFLLDICHAKYSADKLGIEIYDYLNRLPLDKIYEIHVCGWYYDKDGKYRSHTPLNEKCYELLDYILRNSNPEIVTIEFGTISKNGKHLYLSNNDEDLKEIYIEVLSQVNRVKCIIDALRNRDSTFFKNNK